ncbi:MAG: tRNA (adenosine(37)-N6)-threonylcarbamoyltransferase complex dimerization subunit type 1 TsaB [Elusimicrobiota bacterium]
MFLGFDTTGDIFSIAVGKSAEDILETEARSRRRSAMLIPVLDNLLKDAGIEKSGIKAVGMGIGPGSFTGIRVGLSFGITFAQMLNIPAYGISSMDLAGRKYERVISKAYRDKYYLGEYVNKKRSGPFKIISAARAKKTKAKLLKISGASLVKEVAELYEKKVPGDWKKINPIYTMETVYRKKRKTNNE